MPEQYKVVLDTDIGDDIDDALALALALRSPEIDLRGISTVFGDTRERARLAGYLLHLFEREDIPVAIGEEQPLQVCHQPSPVHQASVIEPGFTPALSPLSGPELIVQTVMAHPGEITIICIGPLTNMAKALQMEPHLFMTIRKLVVMGGTSGLPMADWNVRCDAKAAQIVFSAGMPITMIGLNITQRCQLHSQDIDRLYTSTSPQARALSSMMTMWRRYRPKWKSALPYLHDPLTVASICQPELFRFEEIAIRTLTRGPFKGFTVPRLMNGPLVTAAVDVQVEEARSWIMQRICP